MNWNCTLAAPRRNVGDFDCSGADIERDWVARTSCWSKVERIVLTYEQTQAYELPAAPGKRDDPRWLAFARRYGFDVDRPVQWEVEALEPAELQRLVLEAVDAHIDRSQLARQLAEEQRQRRQLAAFLRHFDGSGGPRGLGKPADGALEEGCTHSCLHSWLHRRTQSCAGGTTGGVNPPFRDLGRIAWSDPLGKPISYSDTSFSAIVGGRGLLF